jgi:hypothetical protein
MKIEVTACDRDGEVPALTYEIKVSDGREIKVDLCPRHAAKIEELIEELLDEGGTQAEDESATGSAPEPEQVEQAPVTASAPAKKAPAKKTATKKTVAAKKTAAKTTSGRRRPRVTTLEEIEAQKQQG